MLPDEDTDTGNRRVRGRKGQYLGGEKTHEDDGSKERKIADLSKTDVRDRNSIILLNLFHYIV